MVCIFSSSYLCVNECMFYVPYCMLCGAFGEINDDDDRDACVMCCVCGLNKTHK